MIPAVTPSPQQNNVSDTLRDQLERILGAIPRALNRAANQTEQAATGVPDAAAKLFAKDGPFGFLQFWRDNEENLNRTGTKIRESGQNLIKGDTKRFREQASEIDFSWLNPNSSRSTRDTDQIQISPKDILTDENIRTEFISKVRSIASFAVKSLTPWDFDRHEFNLTLANTWLDEGTLRRNETSGFNQASVIKMTSTIKPLDSEWKLTARSKLLELGGGGVVFGKAGIYIAGDQPPYIGVEADRVWTVPRLSDLGTKLFANVNYRSSRKPETEPVKSSFGIQQEVDISDAYVLTFRIGINPLQRDKLLFTPMPNRSYF